VNAYEGKAGMVYLQVKLCDMSERFETMLALYEYSSFPFPIGSELKMRLCNDTSVENQLADLSNY